MVSWYNAGMDKKTMILAALAVIAVMNIAAFALMGHDKRCARKGKWRVPEKTLFLVTACFGGLGGVLGMKVFHHKTKKRAFTTGVPCILAAHIVLIGVAVWQYC